MIENKRFKASKICKNERKVEVRRNGSRRRLRLRDIPKTKAQLTINHI